MSSKMMQWADYEHLEVLRGWGRAGLTYQQIATNMGVSVATLLTWRKKNDSIREALKVSKTFADTQVENAMFKSATGFMYREQTVTNKGETVWIEKFEKPNTTAQIFYLKNRKPEFWTDRREIKNNFKLEKVEYIARWGQEDNVPVRTEQIYQVDADKQE